MRQATGLGQLSCHCQAPAHHKGLLVQSLTIKIKLRQAATAALPPELREAASQPDYAPFPLNRQIMTDTPPIPGFGEQQRQQQQDAGQSGKRKLGNR